MLLTPVAVSVVYELRSGKTKTEAAPAITEIARLLRIELLDVNPPLAPRKRGKTTHRN
jgi:hypothetical protein